MTSISFSPAVQNQVRFGAGSNQSAIQLLDTLKKTAVIKGPVTKSTYSATTSVEFNGKPYNITIGLDKTFNASNADQSIVIKLFHDKRTYGAPRTFSYTNYNNPSQNVVTRDPSVIGKAEELGRHLNDLATKSSDGDLDI